MLRNQSFGFVLAAVCGAAFANPVDGSYRDADHCDNHGNLRAVEELGTGFPIDELITATWRETDYAACPGDGTPPNVEVEMTNMTDRDWSNLFYVADWTDTSLSNYDGFADDAANPGHEYYAFRIDRVGDNKPLVSESMTQDGIFEAGETWKFVIDDYSNVAGSAPSDLGSLGFAGASSGFTGSDPGVLSSGSIVQFTQVPGPAPVALLGLGGLMVGRRRR